MLSFERRINLRKCSASDNYNYFETKYLIFFFIAITVIAFFFPPSADDLGWATSQGWKLLENKFKDYNGRYLGNIFALIFSRIPIFLPFIKGFTLTSLLKLIQIFSYNKSKEFLIISSIFLAIPTRLFIQAFVWTAGFSNYYFSLLIIMLTLYVVFTKNKQSGFLSCLRIISIIILGISGQLFMETFSVFIIIVSVSLNVYSFVKNRKIDMSHLIYMISCFVGSVIMFSNGVYLKIFNGEDTYQGLTLNHKSLISTAWDCFEKLLGTVSIGFVSACFPTIIFILISSVLLYKHKGIEMNKTKQIFKYSTLTTVILMLIILAVVLVIKNNSMLKMLVGIVLLYVMFLSLIIANQFKNIGARKRTLLYFVFILLQCLPLAVVSPIGPRCFSGAFVITILIAKEFWDEYNLLNIEPLKTSVLNTAKILVAALLIINLFCYSQVYMANNRKIEYIRSEVENGNYTIELDNTQFRFMVYDLDVENINQRYLQRFCEYYRLPTNIEIIYK